MINSLHLDIENGYGGSSRSLSFFLKYIDQRIIQPEVWIAREGPALKRNKKNKIQCRVNNNIKYLIPVKQKNILNFIISIPKILKLIKLAKQLLKHDHDILHLNHEGLLFLAFILRLNGYKKKIILHKRSMFFINFYSKAFIKLTKYVDGIIFISEKEKKNFFELIKYTNIKNQIIYNSYEQINIKNITIKKKKFYKAIYLGTLNYYKAPDRIIDLAFLTKKRKIPIKYEIFGKEIRRKRFFNRKEIDFRYLKDKIDKLSLRDTVFLKNQTMNPKQKLLNSDLLIRPSRRNDNWGRDIIEAMSTGTFIISTGKERIFLTHEINGIVTSKWDIKYLADIISLYLKNKKKLYNIKKNAYNFATKNFNAKKNSQTTQKFFLEVFYH